MKIFPIIKESESINAIVDFVKQHKDHYLDEYGCQVGLETGEAFYQMADYIAGQYAVECAVNDADMTIENCRQHLDVLESCMEFDYSLAVEVANILLSEHIQLF